jgi:hypothetical protein
MAVGGSVKMKADGGEELQDEAACLDGRIRVKPARNEFAGAVRIIHHIQWQYHQLLGTRPEKDIGFPNLSCLGLLADRILASY